MKVSTKKPVGVLAELLADIDEKELARTRKRMMLAAKIGEAMKRCGLNQKQFAKLMGKSPTVISEWLSGDRNFTADTLTDIEEALGVQLLNVSIMTVVSAGAITSYKLQAKNEAESMVNPSGTWSIASKVVENELQRKFAC